MDLSQLASERASDSRRLGLMQKREPPPPKRHASELLLKAPPLKAPSMATPPGLPWWGATHKIHSVMEMRIKAPPPPKTRAPPTTEASQSSSHPANRNASGGQRHEDNVTTPMPSLPPPPLGAPAAWRLEGSLEKPPPPPGPPPFQDKATNTAGAEDFGDTVADTIKEFLRLHNRRAAELDDTPTFQFLMEL